MYRWEFLTEKLAYERRIRETKMKTALIQVNINLFLDIFPLNNLFSI